MGAGIEEGIDDVIREVVEDDVGDVAGGDDLLRLGETVSVLPLMSIGVGLLGVFLLHVRSSGASSSPLEHFSELVFLSSEWLWWCLTGEMEFLLVDTLFVL